METALTKIEIVEAFNPLDIVREMRDQRGMMLPALVRVDGWIMVMAHIIPSCPSVFKNTGIRQTDFETFPQYKTKGVYLIPFRQLVTQ